VSAYQGEPYAKVREAELAALLPQMPVRTAVLLVLASRQNYRVKTARVSDLAALLACPELTLHKTLARMQQAGEVSVAAGIVTRLAAPSRQPGEEAVRPLARPTSAANGKRPKRRNEATLEPTTEPTLVPTTVETASEKPVLDGTQAKPDVVDLQDLHESTTSSSSVTRMEYRDPPAWRAEDGARTKQLGTDLQPGRIAGIWRYLRGLHDENTVRAATILAASKDLFCGVATLPGRVEDNVRIVAQALEKHGLERVMLAWDRSNGKTSRLNYFQSVVSDPLPPRTNTYPTAATAPDTGRSIYDAKPLSRAEIEAAQRRILGEAVA
jgi:hypothetical protein